MRWRNTVFFFGLSAQKNLQKSVVRDIHTETSFFDPKKKSLEIESDGWQVEFCFFFFHFGVSFKFPFFLLSFLPS